MGASDLVTQVATEDLSCGTWAGQVGGGASWVELSYQGHRTEAEEASGKQTASGFVWKPALCCHRAAGWVVSAVTRRAVCLQEGAAGGRLPEHEDVLKRWVLIRQPIHTVWMYKQTQPAPAPSTCCVPLLRCYPVLCSLLPSALQPTSTVAPHRDT